ncbi:hypothetical protein [Streptomyces yaizuensis]|uniref:Uncharacterized protein n=1 Tax=Streptomyces yaizuensis TaxID=2989713 RepID=A0AA86JBK3_9ACTN|nr:hypothetical protein [Streptomyces sp. YSPA8]BDT39528.1 hypothetical protein SYYSPA8_37050 [Streptomyces sp. YSPA8]
MPRNQPTAAQRAREAQAVTGGPYTKLLRAATTAPTAGETWCPDCRYAFLLHREGCPAPAVFRLFDLDFDGPYWGGGLHSHGVEVWVTARADGGRGPWLHPGMALGGADALKGALRLEADGETPDLGHLNAVLRRAFPGAAEGPFALNRYADMDTAPPMLARALWTLDCDGDCAGYDPAW